MTEEMEARYIGIVNEVIKTKRFADFVNLNFQIDDIVDDEAKTIETRVIELKNFSGPPLSSDQKLQILRLLKDAKAEHYPEVFSSIMEVLGQEHGPLVTVETSKLLLS